MKDQNQQCIESTKYCLYTQSLICLIPLQHRAPFLSKTNQYCCTEWPFIMMNMVTVVYFDMIPLLLE